MKKEWKVLITGGLLTLIITLSCIGGIEQSKKIETNSGVALSNTTIGWGIKRNDNHEQPDLGTKNKELISKYNGMAMGNPDKNYIYLTFDLGYEAGYTASILDSLKNEGVTATFFITAHYLNTASDLVERMINEGHIVGNHTVNHKSMPNLSDDEMKKEIMQLNQSLNEKFGYEMKYLRPPKGEFSERSLSIIDSLGFKTVMWSFAYVDWNEDSQPSSSEAIKMITSNLHNGEIILLHATSKTNAEIMSQMIQETKNQGYEFKSLNEFIE